MSWTLNDKKEHLLLELAITKHEKGRQATIEEWDFSEYEQ